MTGPVRRARLAMVLTSSLTSLLLLPPAPAEAASAAGLTISVPSGPVDLGSRGPGGGTIIHSLGSVTVTTSTVLSQDAGWVATVSATSFKTGGGTSPETVPASSIAYMSGPGVPIGLVGTCTAGQPSSPVSLASAVTAFSCTGTAVAGTSLTWNPQITITVGASNVAGKYTGTITHSVV